MPKHPTPELTFVAVLRDNGSFEGRCTMLTSTSEQCPLCDTWTTPNVLHVCEAKRRTDRDQQR